MIKLAKADYLIILVYIVFLVGFGIYISLKNKKAKDLFLAGKSMNKWVVGLSVWGTNIGPSSIIGGASIAYSTGMVAANFEWYAWVFLFLLSTFFIPIYKKLDINTLPQYIKMRYGKRAYYFLTYYSLFTIIILWLGGTLYAGGLLLSQILGLKMWISLVLLMLIATSFTITGGLTAVMITDSFQTILIILGSLALVIIGYFEVGGWKEIIERVPENYWSLIRSSRDDFPWYAILLGYPVLGIWFFCTDQTIVQRVLGSKSIREGQSGVLISGYLKIINPFIFMLPGIFCLILYPKLQDPDQAFVVMLSNHMPVGMMGVMLAILIATLVSTVDSGLNSFSTIFTLDIILQNKAKNNVNSKLIGRIVTASASIIALLFALFLNTFSKDIYNLLASIIAFIAPPMSAVFLLGVLWKKANQASAVFALSAGAFFCIIIGYLQMRNITFGLFEVWPHYLMVSFYLFLLIVFLMLIISFYVNDKSPGINKSLVPSQNNNDVLTDNKISLHHWLLLALIMLSIYIAFQFLI